MTTISLERQSARNHTARENANTGTSRKSHQSLAVLMLLAFPLLLRLPSHATYARCTTSNPNWDHDSTAPPLHLSYLSHSQAEAAQKSPKFHYQCPDQARGRECRQQPKQDDCDFLTREKSHTQARHSHATCNDVLRTKFKSSQTYMPPWKDQNNGSLTKSEEAHHYIHICDSQTPKTRNRNIWMKQVHAKDDQHPRSTSQETLTATKLNIPAIPISNILENTLFSFDTVNWTKVKRAPNAPDMRMSMNDPEKATLAEMAEATAAVRMRVSRE